jgi:hypothetical protein
MYHEALVAGNRRTDFSRPLRSSRNDRKDNTRDDKETLTIKNTSFLAGFYCSILVQNQTRPAVTGYYY